MRQLNIPISALVQYDKEGNPTPRIIKVPNDQDDETTTLRIDVITYSERYGSRREGKYIKFGCRSTMNDRIVDFELLFEYATGIWLLHKM